MFISKNIETSMFLKVTENLKELYIPLFLIILLWKRTKNLMMAGFLKNLKINK
jgi:hypothetical protein